MAEDEKIETMLMDAFTELYRFPRPRQRLKILDSIQETVDFIREETKKEIGL